MTSIESFENGLVSRKIELEFLHDQFSDGLKLVQDQDAVNDIITASDRPDLTLENVVPQYEIDWPYKPIDINNFTPNMRGFGRRVTELTQEVWQNHPTLKFQGRIQLTDEELQQYYFLGARGDYHEHLAFAEANGIDRELANDIQMNTHLAKPAFMRMWIMMPELTRHLMKQCLDEFDKRDTVKNTYEEIYVAYNIMSRLVDKRDRYVIRDDGIVDDWVLCR